MSMIWSSYMIAILFLIPLVFTNIKNKISGIQLKIHEMVFYTIQFLFCFYSSFTLINDNYFMEMIPGILSSIILWIIIGEKLETLMDNLDDPKVKVSLSLSLLVPTFLMSIIRNWFDTYVIGTLIFNISNIGVLLWQLIIISFINIIVKFQDLKRSVSIK